jgi:hypothetical protein
LYYSNHQKLSHPDLSAYAQSGVSGDAIKSAKFADSRIVVDRNPAQSVT